MNDYMDSIDPIARSLAQGRLNAQPITPGVRELPRYLKTAPGRQAARAAVDSLIGTSQLGVPDTAPPYQKLIETLVGTMQQFRNPQAIAATANRQTGWMKRGFEAPPGQVGKTPPPARPDRGY